jgi:catechol O-methyltransferase
MIEPGRHVGYSTIPFGDADRSGGGKEYISLEINPNTAAVASMSIELAGLRTCVRIMVGSSKISRQIDQIDK